MSGGVGIRTCPGTLLRGATQYRREPARYGSAVEQKTHFDQSIMTHGRIPCPSNVPVRAAAPELEIHHPNFQSRFGFRWLRPARREAAHASGVPRGGVDSAWRGRSVNRM